MVDPATFRNVMAQWPSGVTVVTTLDSDGERKGMTASSFSSVSAEPPLVSVCLLKTLYTHKLISESGVFGVNVLAKDQMEVARRFAGMTDAEDRFEGESWTIAETGVSLLDSALGWVDCRVVHQYEGGDHTIFVGEVVAAHNARRSAPLLYHSRGWGQFADVLPDVATVADTGLVSALRRGGHDSEVAGAVAAAAEAGVRVRVADLVTSTAAPDEVLGAITWPADRTDTSVLVGDRIQAQRALEEGVGVVELVTDPGDPLSLEGALATVEGIGERASVELLDPFCEDRRDAVLHAVERLRTAGVREICLPDADGHVTALQVRGLLQEAVPMARPTALRVRLDPKDRLGLVKALTALKSGVRDFDIAVEGLRDAAAVEDLIRLLGTLDVESTVDGEAIAALADRLRTLQTTTELTAAEPPTTVGATG